jgi:hypothetical protein
MPKTCDLPIILTGGGRSPVMPGRQSEPRVCSSRQASPSSWLRDGDRPEDGDRGRALPRPRVVRRSDPAQQACGILDDVSQRAGTIIQPPSEHATPAVAPVGGLADADVGSTASVNEGSRGSDRPRRSIGTERGSQTTEYALLIIVAATITMLVMTWAKQGAIKSVLDGVIAQVLALFGIGGG